MSPRTDRVLDRVSDGADVLVEPPKSFQTLDFSNLPVYLTPGQGAEYLGFSADCRHPVKAFFKFVERHHVPKLHRGSKILFRRADLDLAVAGHDFLLALAERANDGPSGKSEKSRKPVNGRDGIPNTTVHFPDSQKRGRK